MIVHIMINHRRRKYMIMPCKQCSDCCITQCHFGLKLIVNVLSIIHMDKTPGLFKLLELKLPKNWHSHIDASLSRQPLVKGERLMRYEVNAVMIQAADHIMCTHNIASNAMQIYAVFTTIGICMIDNTLTINFKPKCTVIYSVMSCTFIRASAHLLW